MCLLVLDAPSAHGEAQMRAFVVDLGVVTHGAGERKQGRTGGEGGGGALREDRPGVGVQAVISGQQAAMETVARNTRDSPRLCEGG